MCTNRSSRWTTLILAFPVIAGACSDSVSPPRDTTPPIQGDPVAGRTAFLAECGTCHTSQDGFDLSFFSFPDSTIVRRAVGHVDTATAHDIVSHINRLRTANMGRDFRLFQPGGAAVFGDGNLGINLFGTDAWPEGLSTEDLLAINPLSVKIALDFPLWSFEESNLDWMPDTPIADALLDWPIENAGAARPHLEAYYATRGLEHLLNATIILRIAERDLNNPDAPCIMDPFDRFQPEACFEARRWIATLGAQHMLRERNAGSLHSIVHDGWWDVGNAARRSRNTDRVIDNAIVNWAQWMYLGWAFEPGRHSSIYLGLALDALALPRHATFHALRAQVERGRGSLSPYHDVENAARFSPPHWTVSATSFGYRNLVERLEQGWRPNASMNHPDPIEDAAQSVNRAYVLAARKIDDQDRMALQQLRDEVLTLLYQ